MVPISSSRLLGTLGIGTWWEFLSGTHACTQHTHTHTCEQTPSNCAHSFPPPWFAPSEVPVPSWELARALPEDGKLLCSLNISSGKSHKVQQCRGLIWSLCHSPPEMSFYIYLTGGRQGIHVVVRGQLARVGSLFLPCGSGTRTRAKVPLSTEPLAHFIGKLSQRSQDSPKPGV